jgi:hypothetical protein
MRANHHMLLLGSVLVIALCLTQPAISQAATGQQAPSSLPSNLATAFPTQTIQCGSGNVIFSSLSQARTLGVTLQVTVEPEGRLALIESLTGNLQIGDSYKVPSGVSSTTFWEIRPRGGIQMSCHCQGGSLLTPCAYAFSPAQPIQ